MSKLSLRPARECPNIEGKRFMRDKNNRYSVNKIDLNSARVNIEDNTLKQLQKKPLSNKG